MQACQGENCETPGIPVHLHSNGKPLVQRIDDSDQIFLRHPPQEESFGFKFEYRPINQSANSALLNVDGSPEDVRYNIKTGEKDTSVMIVTLPVNEIRAMNFPNPHLVQRKDSDQNPEPDRAEDNFFFDVAHRPDPCMYPHCEIITIQKNNPLLEVSKGMRRVLRLKFGELAERFRHAM